MSSLKLSSYEIKQLISLKEDYWENNFDTNCYAFALGLDIPENEIIYNAYQPGIIGSTIYGLPAKILINMSFEERVFLDMRALKIQFNETLPSDETKYKFIKNSIEKTWIVALFSNNKDFHFVRKSYDGKWYHKIGYFGKPTIYDSNHKIISGIESCTILDYQYVKSYKLQYKLRNKSIF